MLIGRILVREIYFVMQLALPLAYLLFPRRSCLSVQIVALNINPFLRRVSPVAFARKQLVPLDPYRALDHRVVIFCIMEAKEYTPSFTSRSTSIIPFDQQSDDRIIQDEEKLPPVDGGLQAWLFLMASAMLEALVWG
jgi:hypothetical protein